MKTLLSVFLASLAFAVSLGARGLCGADLQESGGPFATVPPATQEQLLKLLPDSAKLAATTAGVPRFYAADLYEYIDGEAVGYHAYDFIGLLNQAYKVKDADVTVDIYDMGEPDNAFGVYASECSSNYHFVQIGAEGYLGDTALNFWQGRYYIKLSGLSPKGNMNSVLESFAQSISQRIQGGKSLPPALALFPAEQLVPHSQKFLKKAPLGHDFLAPAFKATYAWDGKASTLVISQAKDIKEALARVEQLRSHFGKFGKVESLNGLGFDAWQGTSPYEGSTIFFARGQHAVIFMQPPVNPEGFLRQLHAGIPE
jgi:hypothetical protein